MNFQNTKAIFKTSENDFLNIRADLVITSGNHRHQSTSPFSLNPVVCKLKADTQELYNFVDLNVNNFLR